jgi:hypothetical protein
MNPLIAEGTKIIRRWPIVTALLILAAAGAAKWNSTIMPEDTNIHIPAAPAVNAKDYFSQAAQMLQRVTPQPAAGEPDSSPSVSGDIPSLTDSQKDQLVSRMMPAIGKLEEGLKLPYVGDVAAPSKIAFSEKQEDLRLANALETVGRDRQKHGDLLGATRYYLDSIEMGTVTAHDSSPSDVSTGIECSAQGRKALAGVLKRLSYPQSLSVLTRLEQIDQEHVTPCDAVVTDKLFVQKMLLDDFHGDWHEELLKDLGAQAHWPFDFIDSLAYKTESPRTIYDSFTKHMNNLAASAQRPWSDRPQVSTQGIRLDSSFWSITDDWPDIMPMPDFSYGPFCINADTMADRILEQQIALHAYQVKHGNYPQTLHELVPEILKQLPIDPFSDGQIFHYRYSVSWATLTGKLPPGAHISHYQNSPNGYLLYSVGPDGIDNGGQPLVRSLDGVSSLNSLADPTEKGDYVAGVNYF